MRRIAPIILLAALLGSSVAPAQAGDGEAPPHVVVSLQPLHSLAAAVTDGVSEPKLLLAPGDSPHAYSMRPSEARALARADLLVWIGPEFERFLSAAVRNLGADAAVLPLAELDAIELLRGRTGENWEPSGDDEHDHRHDHTVDYHLWLAPDNAATIGHAIAERLAELDPRHASTYRANAADLEARLELLDRELREQLAPVRDVPYVVFHDAYQYFERAYQLRPVGSVTVHPERPPGARHLRDLRRRIDTLGARCVFREPQYAARTVQALTQENTLRHGVLDPLGYGVDPGPDAYFETLRNLADALTDCLAEPAAD